MGMAWSRQIKGRSYYNSNKQRRQSSYVWNSGASLHPDIWNRSVGACIFYLVRWRQVCVLRKLSQFFKLDQVKWKLWSI